MRKLVFIAVLCAFMSASAFADMAQVKITQGPGVGYGGAFTAQVMSGAISYDSVYIGPGSKFLTFCVEITETFTAGNIYYADSRDAAYGGGAGGATDSPSRDYLDPVTAALYTQWLSTDTTNVDTASKYQLAIWNVEQEIEWDHNQWEKFGTNDAIHSAYQLSKFNSSVIQPLIDGVGDPTSIGNVRVMTLWTSYSPGTGTFSGNSQDMLVTPVPAAVLLGILGLGVAGVKLRKFA